MRSGFDSQQPDMDRKGFQRRVEDFVCEHCGREVQGDGYTNHCPQCLWSKHVDDAPGDRTALCGGMMEPIQTLKEGKRDMIVQRCILCGHTKRQTLSPKDDFGVYVSIAQKVADVHAGVSRRKGE